MMEKFKPLKQYHLFDEVSERKRHILDIKKIGLDKKLIISSRVNEWHNYYLNFYRGADVFLGFVDECAEVSYEPCVTEIEKRLGIEKLEDFENLVKIEKIYDKYFD